MKVLFIGNSHTYYNDMPATFAKICKDNGEEVDVTMIARPGAGWQDHIMAPDVRFNIVHGKYDVVVLQHCAHPQGDLNEMEDAGKRLIELVTLSGARPVLFMPWPAEADGIAGLEEIRAAYRKLEIMTGCDLAPVGEVWCSFLEAFPEIELYDNDGQHASKAGSSIAAVTIAETILGRELEA